MSTPLPSPFGQVHLACLPMRAQASHRSELVNQLLRGETYRVLEQQPEWYYIETQHDQYRGWIAANQYQACPEATWAAPWTSVATLATHQDPSSSAFTYLGSPQAGHYPKAWLALSPIERACTAAHRLLHTPYLWGGRTCAGIDCSGLVQVAYRTGGWSLPRDASQQVACGTPIAWGQQQRGDLAFFKNEKGAITHVGLVWSAEQILHASAWVRLDALTAEGIWHQNHLTHHLASLRRLEVPG